MKLRLFRVSDGKTAEIEVDIREDTIESLTILACAEFEVELVHLNYKNNSMFNGTDPAQLAVPLSTFDFIENDIVQVVVPGGPSLAETSHADQELLRLFGNPAIGGAIDTNTVLTNSLSEIPPAQPMTRSAPPALPPGTVSSSTDIYHNLQLQADQDLINMFRNGLGAAGMNNTHVTQFQRTQHNQATMQRNDDDPDLQRKIYKEIQKRNIEENLQNALEYTPEAFARVTMLYVPAEVNGYKMAAFVDSGAQMSVMSEDCAEKCGLSRLIDRKWAGMAHGVGTTKIVGRVHMTMVKISGQVLPMSISILAAKNMDFLIGLDQLKRHQMCIDLKANELRLDDKNSAKFLAEHELPDHVKEGIPGQEAQKEHDAAEAATARVSAPPSIATALNNSNTNNSNTNVKSEAAPLLARAGSASAASMANANLNLPQRRDAVQPLNLHSLTEAQRTAIRNLCEAFNVAPEIAIQTLQAADWNEELAANLMLGMS